MTCSPDVLIIFIIYVCWLSAFTVLPLSLACVSFEAAEKEETKIGSDAKREKANAYDSADSGGLVTACFFFPRSYIHFFFASDHLIWLFETSWLAGDRFVYLRLLVETVIITWCEAEHVHWTARVGGTHRLLSTVCSSGERRFLRRHWLSATNANHSWDAYVSVVWP